jgi:hypothetical protein
MKDGIKKGKWKRKKEGKEERKKELKKTENMYDSVTD